MKYDVVIVGAGAAGLMAAGTAAGAGNKTLLIEKMEKPARKVRITGKGRCNLTNTHSLNDFLSKIRSGADFLKPALQSFDNKTTFDFFEKNGLRLTTERGGRVFPASGKAQDVANALESWARKKGAEIECFTMAESIEVKNGRIASVTVENKKSGKRNTIETPNVIITTGGVSYPSTGSTGDGYMLAHELGHSIAEVRPSLVPLEIGKEFSNALARLALRNVGVTLLVDDKAVQSEFGEMEFFNESVGGAIILRISRDAVDAVIDQRKVEISIDLKPALSKEQLKARIARETEALGPGAPAKDLLRKLVPAQLVAPLGRMSGISVKNGLPLKDSEIEKIISSLKDFRLKIVDYRPFEEAIVTAGGVDLEQVDPATMQSKLVKGLYFAGEVLDIDANTGGYNLQIAFSTGRLAGELKG